MSDKILTPDRRQLIVGSLGVAAMAAATTGAASVQAHPRTTARAAGGRKPYGWVESTDGARIFYKDWGEGQPVIFSHGWPLTADAWDSQMQFMGERGYRVIAHDRRSHGRSDQTWTGNNMDQYADDLEAVLSALDVRNAVLVGHSTGGGEITHYVGRHGTGRVAKMVLVGAVPPLMLKTASNPEGTPLAAFDGIRKATFENRSQFYKDLTTPFYGFNKPGAPEKQDGLRDNFWLQGMMGGLKGQYDCIHEFSEVDYTPGLRRIDKPLLAIHGEADQIVPIAAAALKTVKIVPGAQLKVYEGAPHGLAQTMVDRFNQDLLAFVKA